MQIRARKDLQAFPRGAGVDSHWVVKDPVSFCHFLFSQEEMFLLNLFDGNRTLDQIRDLWQREFQTRSLTDGQLKSLSDRFIRDKLVVVERFGNGVRLHQDERQSNRNQLLMKMSSPLVVKLGGVDPRGILKLLWLPGQLLFNRFVVIANLAIAMVVFIYLIGHFEQIIQRAPTMAGFFSAKNLLVMALIIFIVKIVHELGHAVACRKFGGECFEIGVLLLAFFPTLYCDVTDSWTFRDRWKRIMVSFAGIYIEIILATVCAVLWLLTGPGLLNSIFFNVTVMCSFNTLFINGNPFLKYDGYYIVSDLFEQPNLAQTAKSNLQRVAASFLYDLEEKNVTNSWLALFGLFSMLYRWFVILSIALGVYVLLKSFNFGLLSEGIVFLLLATVGFRMLKQRSSGGVTIRRRLNVMRSLGTLAVVAAVCFGWFYLPLPSHVYCNFVVQSADSSIVFAPVDGKVKLKIDPYELVDPGHVLGEIVNFELADQMEHTIKRLNHLEDQSKRLVKRFEQEATVASQLQLLKNEIQKVRAKSVAQDIEQQSLVLASPISGMIRPLSLDGNRTKRSSGKLQLDGSLFDSVNKDSYVQRGQPLFAVEGLSRKLVSYLGEKDVEFLAEGQAVKVRFNQFPDQILIGTLEEIIEIDVELNEAETESSGMETFVDQIGQTQTLQTPYRVIISVAQVPPEVLVGSGGRCRISVSMRTMAEKTWFIVDRWWKEQNY